MNNLSITKERVKGWSACADGYRWFLEKFPEGGEFIQVYRALIEEKRGDDADWLVGKLFDELDTTTRVKQMTIIAGADEVEIAGRVTAGEEAATTGDWANAATTGDWANAATTGEGANAATTGDWANAATTGEGANAATTGDWANAATTGEGAVAAVLGYGSKAKAEAGGAIVIVKRSNTGALLHIFAAKVGENGIEAGTWYELGEDGKPVAVERSAA